MEKALMKTHSIEKYLSELSIDAFEFSKNYTTLIDSPTGTGKTELIFHLAKNQRAIVAFPYVSQVIQQQEKQANFQFLYDSEKIDYESDKNICCTYDKLTSLIYQDFDLNNYILHLDECHNLYMSADYRNHVIFQIANSIREKIYKQVILYSSTYENKYLQHYIAIDNHQQIELKSSKIENVTCVHLENGNKVTMNDAIVSFFRQNQPKKEKILIYRNNKSENEALGNLLENDGYQTLVVDSDRKQMDDVLEFLKNEELSNQTAVLITTSMLTEGINILNENITQIHYVDKEKSSATIRQFASRPRNSKHEILIWFKKNETLEVRKTYEKEWNDFVTNSKQIENSINFLIERTPENYAEDHLQQIIHSNRMYNDSWLKHGIRCQRGKAILDYPRIANYFYRLNTQNESNNSYLLGESLESYGFQVHYFSLKVPLKKMTQVRNREQLRAIRKHKKIEREALLRYYITNNICVRTRRKEILSQRKRTEEDNRELKLLNRWIGLEKNGIENRTQIYEILKNGTDDRAIYRNLISNANHLDEFYTELKKVINLNERYDAEKRSELIQKAESNARSLGYNLINIKRLKDGTIHGKISKNIFANLFHIQTHVIGGKHSISILSY